MAATTWNPSDIGTNITLSGGNLTAASGGAGGSWRLCRSTTSKTGGKWYFEVSISAVDGSSGVMIGAAESTTSLATFPGGDANSVGLQANSQIYTNGSFSGSNGDPYAAGDVVGVCLDLVNNKVWFWDKTDNRYNGQVIGSQNPATNTGGFSISGFAAPATHPVFASFGFFGGTGGDNITANFGASAFSNTIPSGFDAWDFNEVGRGYVIW